jgi:hypothetical protein
MDQAVSGCKPSGSPQWVGRQECKATARVARQAKRQNHSRQRWIGLRPALPLRQRLHVVMDARAETLL